MSGFGNIFGGLFGGKKDPVVAVEQKAAQAAPQAADNYPVDPSVWETVMDEASGTPYYWNTVTGETSWEMP